MSDNRSLREWLAHDPRYELDPYSGVGGVPSNPAWRYCPTMARTPSPKPANWPPSPLRPMQGPGVLQHEGRQLLFCPNALNPVAGLLPVNVVPVTPQRPAFGYQTPPRRTKPLPISPSFSLPSAPSDDLQSSRKSDVTLGKSGHKASAGIRRCEGMPVMINDDTSSLVTTPDPDSNNPSPVVSHMSDATTLILTPEGPKKVKRNETLTGESGTLLSETSKAKSPAKVLGATSSLKRSSASSSGDTSVTVNVNVSIKNDEGVVKRRRYE